MEHDPELFDELMRTEARRRPVGRVAIVALVAGLIVFAACMVWWRQPFREQLPAGEAHGLDIGVSYQPILERCQAAARPVPGARVQVMTPISVSGAGGKPRAVCYYRFAAEMTAPAR
ncbi:hypothetical protein OHS58_25340 [Amycolatopsis sp. NBC_00348]|uniref:hypothetical protein n=1 Tax=Amycolatopsis sp. NBC_00348 TaxID=2975956 RepID=UPI002E269252